jgi:hypothetical protein
MKKATTKCDLGGFFFSYNCFRVFVFFFLCACHVKYMWEFCLFDWVFCYIVIRFAGGVIVGLVDLFGTVEILR